MKKIIVYCEYSNNKITDASYELISKAHDLKLKAQADFKTDILIEAVIIAKGLERSDKEKMYTSGCDKVVLIKENVNVNFVSTVYSKIFIEYFSQNPSDVILFPASEKTRTLAPRITTTLETGLVADCTELDLILSKDNEIKLASTRPTFGGELMATILSKKNPQCATVRPGTFKIKSIVPIKKEYLEFAPSTYEEPRLKLLRSLISPKNVNNLLEAKIILAGGYGLISNTNKMEYFEKLQKLAKLTGASVGVSRKVVDYGIMDINSQIGQTGHTVKPELYIAFGISGAIQHIIGMKNSKKIIAINTDENADIFKYSDYKIIGDAKKLIDDLLNSII